MSEVGKPWVYMYLATLVHDLSPDGPRTNDFDLGQLQQGEEGWRGMPALVKTSESSA